MLTDRWDEIETLLEQALERPPAERAAFLDDACDASDVRAEVERLLAASDEAGDFFDRLGGRIDAVLGHTAPEASGQPVQVGPYRIQAELGRGGMGTVYLAERSDGQFEQQVALKLVNPGMNSDQVLRRFLAERQILARLQHPHIARLLDGGLTEDGRPYFAMAYIDGLPITSYCNAHRLSVDDRLRLFENVCDAVQYAHRNLVVHRDLKPSNILVVEGDKGRGMVKLLDFGIAKLLAEDADDDGAPLTRTGMQVMTPAYAAPEQHRGEAVTTATDVYALGVVLYELLTGHRPFGRSGSKGDETVPRRPSTRVIRTSPEQDAATRTPEQIAGERGTSPDRLRRRLAGDLDAVVLKALRPEPELRYPSVDALLDDLRRARTGLPVAARRDSLGYRTRTFVRRHRVLLGVGALALVLLVISTAIYAVRITAERDRARREAANTEQTLAFLQDLFQVSDPFQLEAGARSDLTAREILERGARKIRTELTGQPEAQARILAEIGWVHFGLGLYPQADSLLQQALALQRGLEGEQERLAQTLYRIGRVQDELGNYEAGEGALRESVALRRSLYEAPHVEIALALDQLGAHLTDDGAYDEAEPLLREALDMLLAAAGEDHSQTGVAMHNLARLLRRKGDLEQAESYYRRSLELTEQQLGPDHPEVLITRNGLAVVLRQQGRLDEAEQMYRDVLAARIEALGAQHPQVGVSYYNLCTVLGAGGAYAAADSACAVAVSIWREAYGEEHPYVANAIGNRAQLRYREGNQLAAERLFREALALQRAQLPDDHPDLARTLLGLGRLLHERGRIYESEPFLEEARAIYEARLGAEHLQTAEASMFLGATLAAQRRFDEAEPFLTAAYPILRARHGDEHEVTQSARAALADLYTAWGFPDRAAPYADAAD